MSGPELNEKAEDGEITARLRHPETGTIFATAPVSNRSWEEQSKSGEFRFNIRPDSGCTEADCSWPAGIINFDIKVKGESGTAGRSSFLHNYLGASVAVSGGPFKPGQDIPVTGEIFEVSSIASTAEERRRVPAGFSLAVRTPDGDVRGPYGPFTAKSDGTFVQTVPGEATDGITAGPETEFRRVVSVQVVDTSYDDPETGQWASRFAGAAPATLVIPPDSLVVENSFVSAVGWVKPGEVYPFRVFVKNFTSQGASNASVTIPAVDGTTFTDVEALQGSASITGGSITWTIGDVAAATDAGPTVKTLVVEARTDTLEEDPQIVWKNLSTTATLTYTERELALSSTSHGPKVIPQDPIFDTARYGDRPFPVVPVDYFDRKHEEAHSGDRLSNIINSRDVEGSTFNLYQEMSYGQLFPEGTVPSAGIATATFPKGTSEKFTDPQPQGTCHGTTQKDFAGASFYPERIHDGWYQLPGTTDYYGDDRYGTALVGAVAGIGAIFQIDDACGPTGKAVYDAAVISDPEIDYSDYDTDKDGVVDFFMMVYVGEGGHGVSQTSVPPYDNIWPHSSSLEFYYSDPETGLKGYISDDQLKDLQGRPLFYTDKSRSQMTTDDTGIPVFVRVGPYNVNPESSVEKASVISHEYGHSLGLPDFYSFGSRDTYGDWNLMATDKSQHMDVFSKQEMGWLVPRVLPPGRTTASDWGDSKINTHRIDWVDPDGTPYSLEGAGVNNGEAYAAKLPGRQVIDPKKVVEGASPQHVWWSESGNDFGCPPEGGHNLDVYLPELADLDPETDKVKVTFKSYWDIEWDYDYGFVMYTVDEGKTYRSLPSENGYTTPRTQNPNANSCQAQYGNGITGTSGSYQNGTQDIDRFLGDYPDGPFLEDSYDLSEAAGNDTALRFSYSTDAGLARPGWFIDDLKITVNDDVIYSTNFEQSEDPRLFNGGCNENVRTASQCTAGWSYISAIAGSPADHAYYLEMRDRSGFDLNGKGQNDRAPIGFLPGLLLVYTDEAHGYGNVGVDDPPAQTPLDSQPQPHNRRPNLDDAAYTEAVVGDDKANDENSFSDSGKGHTDNYTDPSSKDDLWHFRFNCLTFKVNSMQGRDMGPEDVAEADLYGDVSFRTRNGCAPFDYGFEVPNVAPTAVAQAKPTNPRVGQKVTFDGSGSSDDRQGPQSLVYKWDFNADGKYDDTGQTTKHAYRRPGTYRATLQVRDAEGLTDLDRVTITVGPKKKTAGGGGGGGGGGDDEVGGERQADRPPTRPAGEAAGEAEGAGLAVTGLAIWALVLTAITLLAGGRLLARRRHDVWTWPPDGGS